MEIRSQLKVWTDKGRSDDVIKVNHKEMGTMRIELSWLRTEFKKILMMVCIKTNTVHLVSSIYLLLMRLLHVTGGRT
jgi:hypothetical protein